MRPAASASRMTSWQVTTVRRGSSAAEQVSLPVVDDVDDVGVEIAHAAADRPRTGRRSRRACSTRQSGGARPPGTMSGGRTRVTAHLPAHQRLPQALRVEPHAGLLLVAVVVEQRDAQSVGRARDGVITRRAQENTASAVIWPKSQIFLYLRPADEHPGYQRLPRRRFRRAGQRRRAGRRRSKKSGSTGASTAPASRRWPPSAVLASAGVAPGDIDHVAMSRDPKANLHKKILFAIQKRPSFTKLVKDRLANVAKVRGVDDALAAALGVEPRALRAKFHGVEHHKSHISSAFFISPFEEAACLSIDGFGDFVSTMRARRARSHARDHRSRSSSPTPPGCSTRRSRSSSGSTATARNGR